MREHIFILIRYRGAKKPDKSFPFLGVSLKFRVCELQDLALRPLSSSCQLTHASVGLIPHNFPFLCVMMMLSYRDGFEQN
jgi:hypothetical protein